MSTAWDFVSIWKQHLEDDSPPPDYPTFLIWNAVNGGGLCKYLSGGEVRKLVTAVTGYGHLEGQLVSVVGDGEIASPATQTVVGGILTLSVPAATVIGGLGYVGKVQFLPLGGDGQTVNQGKDRKLFDTTFRVWKSLGGKFGKDEDSLREIEYTSVEQVNMNPDDDVLFTGDLHYVPAESSFLPYWSPVFIQDEPLPFMLLASIFRSEISEEK